MFENKLTLPPTKNTRELDVRQLGWAISTPPHIFFGFENYGERRHRKKMDRGYIVCSLGRASTMGMLVRTH